MIEFHETTSLFPGGNTYARELLDSVPQVASAIFGAVSSSVLLLDYETDDLVFCSVSNEAEKSLVGVRFPAELGIAGWVVSSGEPVIVDDVARVEVFAHEVAEASGHVPESIMAAPLIYDGRTLGVLEVIDPSPQCRSNLNELELLTLFAAQASISLRVLTSGAWNNEPEFSGISSGVPRLTSEECAAGKRIVRMLEKLIEAR